MKQTIRAGDSVVVKQRFRDPDVGVNLKGWQGRVVALHDNPQRGVELEIDWDSITLQSLPYRYLERYPERDLPQKTKLTSANHLRTQMLGQRW